LPDLTYTTNIINLGNDKIIINFLEEVSLKSMMILIDTYYKRMHYSKAVKQSLTIILPELKS